MRNCFLGLGCFATKLCASQIDLMSRVLSKLKMTSQQINNCVFNSGGIT